MNPTICGTEHIVFLVIFVVISIISLILIAKYVKTEKTKTILIKSLAGLLLCAILCNRISLAVINNDWTRLIPNTFCGLDSLVLALALLIGKKKQRSFAFCSIYSVCWRTSHTYLSRFYRIIPYHLSPCFFIRVNSPRTQPILVHFSPDVGLVYSKLQKMEKSSHRIFGLYNIGNILDICVRCQYCFLYKSPYNRQHSSNSMGISTNFCSRIRIVHASVRAYQKETPK